MPRFNAVVVRIARKVLGVVSLNGGSSSGAIAVDIAEAELLGNLLVVLPARLTGVVHAGRREGRSVSGGKEAARFLLAKRAKAEFTPLAAFSASSGIGVFGCIVGLGLLRVESGRFAVRIRKNVRGSARADSRQMVILE
jgi:hypothetical protein